MKRLLFVCVCGGLLSSAAMAQDAYKTWLVQQEFRGTQIEYIRVSSQKPLVKTEETDAEVADILKELEALEAESSDNEITED